MNYYEIDPQPGYWLLGDIRKDDEVLDNEPFLSGVPLERAKVHWLDIAIEMAEREAAFTFTTLFVPIVRCDVADKIAQIPEVRARVEFVLARVAGAAAHFAVLNVLDVVDAIDHSLSRYSLWTPEENDDRAGTIHTLEHVVLDAKKTTGHHLFRLKDYPFALIASEMLKTALGDVEGIEWVPVDVR